MDITVETVHAQLPGTDCGDCGERTCMRFAYRLATDHSIAVEACPHLADESRQRLQGLKELLGRRSNMALIVDEDRCTACNECVLICPINLSLFDIGNDAAMPLVIADDVVKVANNCGALHSCVRCVDICPVDAITLV